MGVYIPPSSDPETILDSVREAMRGYRMPVIILGDLNARWASDKDRETEIMTGIMDTG